MTIILLKCTLCFFVWLYAWPFFKFPFACWQRRRALAGQVRWGRPWKNRLVYQDDLAWKPDAVSVPRTLSIAIPYTRARGILSLLATLAVFCPLIYGTGILLRSLLGPLADPEIAMVPGILYFAATGFLFFLSLGVFCAYHSLNLLWSADSQVLIGNGSVQFRFGGDSFSEPVRNYEGIGIYGYWEHETKEYSFGGLACGSIGYNAFFAVVLKHSSPDRTIPLLTRVTDLQEAELKAKIFRAQLGIGALKAQA